MSSAVTLSALLIIVSTASDLNSQISSPIIGDKMTKSILKNWTILTFSLSNNDDDVWWKDLSCCR